MNQNYYPHLHAHHAHHAGVDVPLPPWWSVFPVTAPFGAAKWGSDLYTRNLGGGSRPAPSTDWSTLAKVGLVVGVGLGAYFLYRGFRSSAVMSREAIRGAMEGG
jgi:hypothetical protein